MEDASVRDCVRQDTVFHGATCPDGHDLGPSTDFLLLALLEPVPAHDLDQTGVVSETELLRCPRNVPGVPLQGLDEIEGSRVTGEPIGEVEREAQVGG